MTTVVCAGRLTWFFCWMLSLVVRREVDEVLDVVENLRELFALLHRRLLV